MPGLRLYTSDFVRVSLRIGGRLADPKEVSVVEVTSRGTGVSPVVNPANGGMEHLHGQDAHATKIQPHPFVRMSLRIAGVSVGSP
jgi:hypothetical protein